MEGKSWASLPMVTYPTPAPTPAGHRSTGLDAFTKVKVGSLKGLLPHVCSQAHLLLWAGGPPLSQRLGLFLPPPTASISWTSERAVLAAGAWDTALFLLR